MDYVIHLLRYDLDCNEEDLLKHKESLKDKNINECDKSYLSDQVEKISINIKELTLALKILNGKKKPQRSEGK